jgi:peptide/nickel transport system substrate-binding protein
MSSHDDDFRLAQKLRSALEAIAPNRRQVLQGISAGVSASLLGNYAWAEGKAPLRVAIALTDIPLLWGGPNGGFQAFTAGGYTIYDALINWDLEHEDRASGLVPGLAESWTVDPKNSSRWILKLRRGVSFHDGSPFNADAVVWNFESVFNKSAPQYHARRAALIISRLFSIAGVEKIDDYTIAVKTRVPDAMTPYQISFFLMVSLAHYEKLGKNWNKFAVSPSGTGPFKFSKLVPRTRLELVRNESYWDKGRVAKSPALTFRPIADANARIAALRSGEVDMAETAPPDSLAGLKAAGLKVRMNERPSVSIWDLSHLPDSPFKDLRVRKAANLAVDREGLVKLHAGAAVAAKGLVFEDSPWFGKPTFKLRHDPDEAKKLLAEAGYGPHKRVKAKVLLSSSGSGETLPLAVAELTQANLAAVGIDVDFKVVDFVTLFTDFRQGAKAPVNAGIQAMSLPAPVQDPTSTFVRGFKSNLVPPRGSNWGYYSNPKIDAALTAAQNSLGPGELDKALAKVHEMLVDDVPWLILFHDLDPWATSSKVVDFRVPRSWFMNVTSAWVK